MRRLLLACTMLLPVVAANAACPDDAAIARTAAALIAGTPVAAFEGLSMADAECARGKLVPVLAREWGAPVGYKAGATGTAVQRLFGLSGPVHGVIFQSSVSLKDGGEIAITPAVAGVGVEADLIVRVRDDGINTAGSDHVAILRHLDQVIPYIEMPRVGLIPPVDGPKLVSVNVAARLGVVGAPIPAVASEDFAARLASMTVILADDQKELARAPGSNLLGHPLNVVPWLIADLAKSGQRLKAGDLISLGGFAPSVPAVAGRSYSLTYEGLAPAPIAVRLAVR